MGLYITLYKLYSFKRKSFTKYIHSYAEHLVPCYSELAEVGKAQGFLVFGHDHVGHGQSEGERALVGDMEELTDPVIQHCREKVKENPGVPLFIIGHSLGGLITLLASLSPQMPRLSGLLSQLYGCELRH